ncbi:MAG: hypothetical protein A3B38_04575 [Candidatus Levybacteria bacterium RIFCSPLOWO2_01_FULL_36_13]|nr:MAG: hypothetical protein A2684_00325 [Candidatus Levybacteria bacterium RIFCSPHIGHO2_01_FULL_36_15b]OGH34102.1 MAG: hypothetical protein A3B38_04575 [Candidatus Levybacteria bacterium RIFCSPLOWO2_01_FULL_36_13]
MGIEFRDTGIIGRFIRRPREITQDSTFYLKRANNRYDLEDDQTILSRRSTYSSYSLQEDGSVIETDYANVFHLVDLLEYSPRPCQVVVFQRTLPKEELASGYKIPHSHWRIIKT